ncbi:MAG: agmatinase [Desulfobacteraceae bacterium]|nr:agmatinase [Pseudomonadota bacterium]MBU4463972.1 agmatinase [Pseudomonadota bacterium]MCG2755561.1 agmatinase [Desulfobacteraceae bacterium]
MKLSVHPGAFGAVSEEFCRYEAASIAILPVPYDGTSTWMKGSNSGPQALLDASANMELYDIETDSEVFKRGIVTMDPVLCPDDPEAMVNVVYKRAKSILEDGKFIVGIGGEHTISVGLVRAVAEKVRDLSVLQLDAHSDTRNEYEGSRYNHACVMSRIAEICPYVQTGIRSMDSSELERLDRDRIFFAHEMLKDSKVISRMLKALTQNVYITIDLDVFDPSVMPSTGTPEPGGLDWYTLIELIESVVREKNVVGMDVTELLPNPANRAPDFVAAKLIYRVLSMIFAKRKEN